MRKVNTRIRKSWKVKSVVNITINFRNYRYGRERGRRQGRQKKARGPPSPDGGPQDRRGGKERSPPWGGVAPAIGPQRGKASGGAAGGWRPEGRPPGGALRAPSQD